MDWRHQLELLTAARRSYGAPINMAVWVKTNGGMGSLYRSQHELIYVFKNGTAPHVNNVELGRYGRNRTNVWTYPGVNTFRAGRDDELAMHPTVKPVDMVADALLDCSNRGGIVLDCFGGSGTTLIAAEKTGRRARLMELDPLYVDVTLRRYKALTGEDAVHVGSGLTFSALEAKRNGADTSSDTAADKEVRDV
jgi:DNA modification methylase